MVISNSVPSSTVNLLMKFLSQSSISSDLDDTWRIIKKEIRNYILLRFVLIFIEIVFVVLLVQFGLWIILVMFAKFDNLEREKMNFNIAIYNRLQIRTGPRIDFDTSCIGIMKPATSIAITKRLSCRKTDFTKKHILTVYQRFDGRGLIDNFVIDFIYFSVFRLYFNFSQRRSIHIIGWSCITRCCRVRRGHFSPI